MPTIQEIVESDLNMEKGASDSSHIDNDPNMTKIAKDLGLFSDEDESAANNNEKIAGVSNMDSLYNELFPEDGVMKTASQEKVAAEEVMGARAYDYFADRMNQRIVKLAGEAISQDSEPEQQLDNNKPDDADENIDTDPEYTDEVSKGDDNRVVGHYESKEQEMQVKAAAIRKAVLLQGLRGQSCVLSLFV